MLQRQGGQRRETLGTRLTVYLGFRRSNGAPGFREARVFENAQSLTLSSFWSPNGVKVPGVPSRDLENWYENRLFPLYR